MNGSLTLRYQTHISPIPNQILSLIEDLRYPRICQLIEQFAEKIRQELLDAFGFGLCDAAPNCHPSEQEIINWA